MNSAKAVRVLATLVIAIAVASAGLLGGAAPALAKTKAKPRVYTFHVDSRGGVLYYHRVRGCTKELDGVHVKRVRATLGGIKKAGYRPCPKCKPAGYTKPPKRLYASKYSRYYSQNRKARFITAHRGGRLTLTWKQVVRRKLIPDPKTKPYGWVGFRAYSQAEPPSFIADALAEINRQRAAQGNPPVSFSATRSAACESWARHLLAVRGVTGHDTMHTIGMDWSEPQSVGAGSESVGWGHKPHLNLLNGELIGGESWEHCAPLVDDPTIAYVGAAMVYKRTSIGWDGFAAECVQSDGVILRGCSIEVSPASTSVGATATATARIVPDTPGDTFTWSVADPSVASLAVSGPVATITGLSAGTTTIHVRTGLSQVDATATVTIVP